MKMAVFSQCGRGPIECSLLDVITERHELISRSSLVKYGQSVAATVTAAQLLLERCQVGL
jgi:hypothetical protein